MSSTPKRESRCLALPLTPIPEITNGWVTGLEEEEAARVGAEYTSTASFPPEADSSDAQRYQRSDSIVCHVSCHRSFLDAYGMTTHGRQQYATSQASVPPYDDLAAGTGTASASDTNIFLTPSQADEEAEAGPSDDPTPSSSPSVSGTAGSSLMPHVHRHLKHLCEECGKGFDSAERARDHAYQVRGEMPRVCGGACGRSA